MSDQRVEAGHPVTFAVDYPDRPLNRVTTALRIFAAIPIVIVLGYRARLGSAHQAPDLLGAQATGQVNDAGAGVSEGHQPEAQLGLGACDGSDTDVLTCVRLRGCTPCSAAAPDVNVHRF